MVAALAGLTNSKKVTTSSTTPFKTGTPQFNPGPAPATGPTQISLTSATPGAVIYYTTDGTTLDRQLAHFLDAAHHRALPDGAEALAVCSGYQNSTVTSYHFGLLIPESTAVTTLTGGLQGYTDGPLSGAQPSNPNGLCLDANGVLYVADTGNNAIRTITPAGQVATLAGGPTNGTFNHPEGILCGSRRQSFVADVYNCAVREVTPTGVVSTFYSNSVSLSSLNSSIALSPAYGESYVFKALLGPSPPSMADRGAASIWTRTLSPWALLTYTPRPHRGSGAVRFTSRALLRR